MVFLPKHMVATARFFVFFCNRNAHSQRACFSEAWGLVQAALKTCKCRHFEGPVLEPVRTFRVWVPGHCSGPENAELSAFFRVLAVLPFRILSGSVAPLNIRIYHNLSPQPPISTLTACRCTQTTTYHAHINSPTHAKQH